MGKEKISLNRIIAVRSVMCSDMMKGGGQRAHGQDEAAGV